MTPGRVLQTSQPDRSKSNSDRVTAISTRNAPSVSTDRPGTGSDRIWVRSFANTAFDLSSFKEAIVRGYKEDKQFSKALVDGVSSGVYVLWNGLLFTGPARNRLCTPDVRVKGGRKGTGMNLRELLISHCHESSVGHMGTVKTAERLHEAYYWKTSTGDVKKYVDSCHQCQMKKTSPTKQYGKNHPLPVPGRPWEWVSMDF